VNYLSNEFKAKKSESSFSLELPQVSKLTEILTKDKQLSEDKPRLQLFLAFAQLFDSELQRNLNRTSFELDDAYNTHNPHAWLEFKQYPPVRRYVTDYLDEEQLMQARKAISQDGSITKTKDAIDLQSIVEGKQKADQNTNIIVFYMPQKDYTKV
jgi:hypothetical protein